VTAEQRALLDQAVVILRATVATRPPPAGTLHYGLFALSRLLEEIARSHGRRGVATDPVGEAALEISRHIVDQGVRLAEPATTPDHQDHREDER
jgi:hypothetical protein